MKAFCVFYISFKVFSVFLKKKKKIYIRKHIWFLFKKTMYWHLKYECNFFFFTFVICQHTPALHINIFYISIHVSYTIRFNNTYVVTNNTFGFKSVWKTFSSFFYLESFRDFKSESPYELLEMYSFSGPRFFFVLFLETEKTIVRSCPNTFYSLLILIKDACKCFFTVHIFFRKKNPVSNVLNDKKKIDFQRIKITLLRDSCLAVFRIQNLTL